MPDPEGLFGELDASLGQRAVRAFVHVVHKAYLDGVRAGRGDRKARPAVVDMGTQWEDRHDRRG
ncbi:hypothetical protein PA7_39380 [Pseudonocardia asaccharolytica DSM 44247 = NBRC 16224]|uniref:Uncharacterized protein n=1 Tax=Pseudonocardia asaccharolytica DSM 44247 = NBRC 16224 TaxID=1123024 RepID=A0A511D5N3_9PSEU|nr:hypothetical protein PA7_39380 [Pseudonocardia asaccharolytica DSM 44247 = NBRC 16224]